MKAAQLTRFGGNEGVVITSMSIPAVSNGKLLVAVHAAGVNPVDWKIRSGIIKIPLPAILGGDFSGIIKEIGPGVVNFKPGDEVYGQSAVHRGGSGAFEEFALADQDAVALKPKRISHVEAGALPLVGVSALQALENYMKLSEGQSVLIHGGGGGIGSIAIQVARHIGARVSTTVGERDVDFVKRLGADRIIDFRRKKFEDEAGDMDAVLDLVGGETYRRSFPVLKKGGIIVSLLENPDEMMMKRYGVRAVLQLTQVNSARLERLSKLVDEGIVKIHIDKIFPLERTGEALAYLELDHPSGKVVLDVSPTLH
jgi:alcohol dehydrogenase